MRFLKGGGGAGTDDRALKWCWSYFEWLLDKSVGIASDAELLDLLRDDVDKSAGAKLIGDDEATGTLETAKSAALKLYFWFEIVDDDVLVEVVDDGIDWVIGTIGLPPRLLMEDSLCCELEPPVGDADIGGGVSILLDDDVDDDDDFGGFIIIELIASCCNFKSDADGAKYILFAANVVFANGSGIPYLSCNCCWYDDDKDCEKSAE